MSATSIPPLEVFSLGADFVHLSKRGLPIAPDGEYDYENEPNATWSSAPQSHSAVTNLIDSLQEIKPKGSGGEDPRILGAFLESALHPDAVDDRKGAFMDGISLLSHLPATSSTAKQISDSAVTCLYETLPHPPPSELGATHSFRQADGRGNNLHDPELGRAGTRYARCVEGKSAVIPAALPDPELIFDTLLRARDRKVHPAGMSGLMFAFAALITASVFRTDACDPTVNATSAYLDLSPLYGTDQASQDTVRERRVGRGLLHPDVFAEDRLALLPPAACALLVILNRNHNYVADMLLKINERGAWRNPPPEEQHARAKQDEEIFQTARLINCGHFMEAVIADYLGGFLGLSEGIVSPLVDKVLAPIKDKGTGKVLERGAGNHCSVELNLVYQWHATLSASDQEWAQTMPHGGQHASDDPRARTFGGLIRGEDGRFADDALARVLQDATASPAGAFRARGTPAALRTPAVHAITQARRWGVCTMNEFRAFLRLRPFKSFEEWNPDREIAAAARRLYGHVSNLELFVGLQCEATVPLKPGVRFASGYTLMCAVLSDTVTLLRGDRYFTTDFTPRNLTRWGYQDCQRDPHNNGFGGEMPKLLMRHLPRHYLPTSVYGCFPFFTPEQMKKSLTTQGIAAQYTFQRPVPVPQVKVLHTFTGIKYVFDNPERFHNVYDMKGLGGGYGFFLSFDDRKRHDPDRVRALHALFPSKNSLAEYGAWFRDATVQKIKERSWKYDGVQGNYVDIVRSVINAVTVHWAADQLAGLPVKTKENPRGLYTEQEFYEMFATLFTFTFIGIGDIEHDGSLTYEATQAGGVLQALVAKSVLEVAPQTAENAVLGLVSRVSNIFWPPAQKPWYPFLKGLADTGRPMNELVAQVMGIAGGSCANLAQGVVHVIDFYLDDARDKERAEILKLVHSEDAKSVALLRGYVREGMRLNPQYCGLWREVMEDAVIPQGPSLPPLEVKVGDRVWASFKNAHLNPLEFPNPTAVDPTRPIASYSLNGTGFHICPGLDLAGLAITEVLKVVFRLKNVRRVSGPAGSLAGYKTVINETETNMYLTPYGVSTPWPSSMHLVYDD
ncbi:heme peroxidase [Mycena belliarum]|uniref:Heme peroxidase n=1 Tax=Mycena belliarum TaxID=1033014 RepID=A0AAD6XJP5_9AGAR|nr:heme peroxidase [Mycena belliae]